MKHLCFFDRLYMTVASLCVFASILPAQPVSGTTTAKPDGMATIVLKVDKPVYPDGSGYQMLIDNTGRARAFWDGLEGDIFDPSDAEEAYALCPYKIPEDADPNYWTSAIIDQGESDSISVPAGVYDIAIINPTTEYDDWGYPTDGYLHIAYQGIYSSLSMTAGATYVFEVSLDPISENDLVTYYPPANLVDLTATQIHIPAASYNLGTQETIGFDISNISSTDATTPFAVYYQINNNLPVEETCSIEIPAGDTATYTFSTAADLSQTQIYDIKCWSTYPGDPDPANDTASGQTERQEVCEIPYVEHFDDPDCLDDWTLLDRNPNTTGWEFMNNIYLGDATGNRDGGAAFFWYSDEGNADNYLISKPIRLKTGQNNISFYYRPKTSVYPESFEFLIGGDIVPENMTLINKWENLMDNSFWGIYNYNIQVPEDSVIHLAFHVTSPAGAGGLWIDEVSVNSGSVTNNPDLEVSQVMLPLSACHLSDQTPVFASIKNVGSDTAWGFRAWYSVNGGDAIYQDFQDTLVRNDTKDFYFTETADFSEVGQTYTVTVGVELTADAAVPEINLDNNTAQASTTHRTPIVPPYASVFTNLDWRPYEAESWTLRSDTSYYARTGHDPLVSDCFDLEPGQYYFTFLYAAGSLNWGTTNYENDILQFSMGNSTESPDTWEVFYSDTTHTSGNMADPYIWGETTFTVETAGTYAFAITVMNSPNGTAFRSIRISPIVEHEARINHAGISLPAYAPLDQLKSAITSAEIENRGSEAATATVEITHNGEPLGKQENIDLAAGEKKTVAISTPILDAVAGRRVDIEAIVSIESEPAELLDDNRFAFSINATDSVLKRDHFEGDFANCNAIGTSRPSSLGIPYTLEAADTLTSIGIGFADKAGENPLSFALLEWNPENEQYGQEIYSYSGLRGKEAALHIYPVPDLILPTGDYLLRINQLNINSLDLVVDEAEDGLFYNIYADGSLEAENDLGNPCVRLNFGHNGKVYPKDVMIEKIAKPVEEGVFSINEPVEVVLFNKGTEATGEFSTYCLADKTLLEMPVRSMQPGERRSIIFEADLSSPQTHVLTIYTQLAEDGNTGNDTASLMVNCLEATDPYVMDFENCVDFAISNFNPTWTSVDQDQAYSYGIIDYTFPNSGMPFGFIAFNPSGCTPDAQSIAPAYQGEKYGASFCAIGKDNNDWLISPALLLPQDTAFLRFYAKSISEEEGNERFNILISTENSSIAGFEPIGETLSAPFEWTPFSIDLSAYAGQTVQIAIQCVSSDAFIFMIDDIRISKPDVGLQASVFGDVSIYPNPAKESCQIQGSNIFTGIEVADMSGRIVYRNMNLATGNFLLHVDNWNSGLYLIKLYKKEENAVFKLIVR